MEISNPSSKPSNEPSITPATSTTSVPEQVRKITTEEGEFEFPVRTLSSPVDWPAAQDLRFRYEMPIVGTNRKIAFSLRGISLEDMEAIEVDCPIPEPPEGVEGDPKRRLMFQHEYDAAVRKKQVLVFEKALGQVMPGVSIDEKIVFLNGKNPGEVEALFLYIKRDVCGFTDGSLLTNYHLATTNAITDSDVIEISSFEDWKTAAQVNHIFRFQRPVDEYITEVPVRGISSGTKRSIDDQVQEPTPPKAPKRNPQTGRFDPSLGYEANLKDPGWRKQMRLVNQLRMVLTFEAALTFPLPGTTHAEKYAWLAARSVGDVIRIKEFIDRDVLGYESRYHFF